MTAGTSKMYDKAMKLSDEERDELISELLASLDYPGGKNDAADPGADEAWNAEIDRRIAEVDSRKAVEVDPLEMIEELLAGLK